MDGFNSDNTQHNNNTSNIRDFLLYVQSLDDNLNVLDDRFLELIKNRCGAISIDVNSFLSTKKDSVFLHISIQEEEQGILKKLTTIKVPSLNEAIPPYTTTNHDNFLVYLVLVEHEKYIQPASNYTGNISDYRQLLSSEVDVVPFRPLAYTLSTESDLYIKNGIAVEESNIDNFIPIDFLDKYYPLFIPINKCYRSKEYIFHTLKSNNSTIQLAANFYINI